MTALLMALGIALVGASAWLLARAYVLPRLRFEAHLRDVESYGFTQHTAEVEVGSARGSLNTAINAAAVRIGHSLIARVPRLAPLPKGQLTAAGHYDITQEAMHGYRAMTAVFFPALVILYAANDGGFSLLILALAAVTAVLGWELPALLVRHRARSRLNLVDHDLPQFIDLLVATIEAGSGFGSALNGVANRFHGPLGDELRLTMRQQSLGIATERALADMAERIVNAVAAELAGQTHPQR